MSTRIHTQKESEVNRSDDVALMNSENPICELICVWYNGKF